MISEQRLKDRVTALSPFGTEVLSIVREKTLVHLKTITAKKNGRTMSSRPKEREFSFPPQLDLRLFEANRLRNTADQSNIGFCTLELIRGALHSHRSNLDFKCAV